MNREEMIALFMAKGDSREQAEHWASIAEGEWGDDVEMPDEAVPEEKPPSGPSP